MSTARKQLIFLLALGMAMVSGCRRDSRLYRFMDHLKSENVLHSPLADLDDFFDAVDRTWSEADMTLLEGGVSRSWAVPTDGLLLGWPNQDVPEGMQVWRNGETLPSDPDLDTEGPAWTWRRISEVIEPEIYPEHKKFKSDAVLLSRNEYFVSPEILLPGGETLFEITAFSQNGMQYLPMLEVHLDDEYIGKIPVFAYKKYRFVHDVGTGRHRIKLGFSETMDRAAPEKPPELLLDRISISCSRDFILITAPADTNPETKPTYRAVYRVQPPRRFIMPREFDPDSRRELSLRLNSVPFFEKDVDLLAGRNTFEVFGFTREHGTYLRFWMDDIPIGIHSIRPWRRGSFLFRADASAGRHKLRLEWRRPGKEKISPHTFDIHTILHRGPVLNTWLPLHKIKSGSPNRDLGIGENPFSLKKKLETGEYSLNALLAPPDSEFSFPVRIPANARLEFGCGVNWKSGDFDADGVRFRIRLEKRGFSRLVFDRTLIAGDTSGTPVFFQEGIDLNMFSGEKFRISFQTSLPRADTSREYAPGGQTAFWFDPVLRGRMGAESEVRSNGRANVILLSLDTLRADHLGCFGYDRDTSPHLDEFARECVVFTQCFSQAPYTISSHMSMLTALNPVRHRVYSMNNSLSPDILTLADHLRASGYSTGAFTGGGQVSHIFGFGKGFDSYNEPRAHVYQEGGIPRLRRLFSDWLEKNRWNEFFLFLHTYQLHDPYAPPDPYNTMFTDDDSIWKDVFMARDLLDLRRHRFQALPEKHRRNVVALYDGEIRYTDDELVEPLMARLKELDLYDRTMIIVTSDHGEEFFDHGGWLHSATLYNELIHVPLMIKFPGSRYGGRRIDDVVRLIDILPTILDTLKIRFSAGDMDGRSLLGPVRGNGEGSRIFYSEIKDLTDIPDRIAAGRSGKKLIFNHSYPEAEAALFEPPPPDVATVEIFDLIRDPEERDNLAERRPDLSRSLLALIEEYQKRMKEMIDEKGKPALDRQLRERLKALGYIK